MDTVRGKIGRSGLVSLVDRKSRYLLSERVPKVNAKNVTQAMIDLLHTATPKRVRTLTPDRGTEFAGYREVGKELWYLSLFSRPARTTTTWDQRKYQWSHPRVFSQRN